MTHYLYGMGLLVILLHGAATAQSNDTLSLTLAVAAALERNPRILAAMQNVEVAHGRILQAGRIPNPEFSLSWNETPTDFSLRDADERDIGISQQIEFPTRRSLRIEAAEQDREIAALRLERARRLMAAQVRTAYYEARFHQEVVYALEGQQRLMRDVQQVLMDKYTTGTGNYLDVIRGKVEMARLNNDIAEAMRNFQIRKSELNLLLGRDADHPMILTDSLAVQPSASNRDSLVHVLLASSATMKIAARTMSREEAAVGLARASYLPDFTLGIFHQRRAEEPPFNANQFTGTSTSSLGIQLGISIPLWFWLEPAGQVREANALRTIAEIRAGHVNRSVRAAIQNAIGSVEIAEARVRVFEESLLDDTRDILATALSQYQNNQIDLLNLLDVYRTARGTQFEYARALLNHLIALADLGSSAELPLEE